MTLRGRLRRFVGRQGNAELLQSTREGIGVKVEKRGCAARGGGPRITPG